MQFVLSDPVWKLDLLKGWRKNDLKQDQLD